VIFNQGAFCTTVQILVVGTGCRSGNEKRGSLEWIERARSEREKDNEKVSAQVAEHQSSSRRTRDPYLLDGKKSIILLSER